MRQVRAAYKIILPQQIWQNQLLAGLRPEMKTICNKPIPRKACLCFWERFSARLRKLFLFSFQKQLTAAEFHDKLVLPLKRVYFFVFIFKSVSLPKREANNSVNQEVPK
ncbi:MAG TPA: hypothetical protein DEP43_06065 [Ruminococcaceae bacterium]|nr:hypothetical protein [Oscillospiraceae bacterium]HCB65511.1 hypothetical protein [Oscillospiraceae bacterium]HCU33521.1 hypothetical protein [Oscillospiraceae bacterium]